MAIDAAYRRLSHATPEAVEELKRMVLHDFLLTASEEMCDKKEAAAQEGVVAIEKRRNRVYGVEPATG